MKRRGLIVLYLVLGMSLCACGKDKVPEVTTEATETIEVPNGDLVIENYETEPEVTEGDNEVVSEETMIEEEDVEVHADENAETEPETTEDPRIYVGTDGNTYYLPDSASKDFEGEVVVDYSKETEPEYTHMELISGDEYDINEIGLDIKKSEWDNYYKMFNENPDRYVGTVIKVKGISNKDGIYHTIYVDSVATRMEYRALTYPGNGVPVDIIGTIQQEEDGTLYIDNSTVYIMW